ncbi:MAG: MFS transporter [Gammaproteobacteria bacterium]|nr:MFS transporter [Gammaproteobacteria bacterium]
MKKQKTLLTMAPLFLVIAIDSMGLGILFPTLSAMLISHHSNFLPSHTTDFLRELMYGVTIGIYMIAWFFGSAIFGDLSDSIGRKKSLLICLGGAASGYFISAIAILCHSLLFLIIGRIIAGFTAGSQPIAQAAIIDVSSEADRARNIGYILFAASIGFVLGPFAGGVLSNSNFVSWFNFSTPLFFAGVLSLLNYLLLVITFKETFTHTHKVKIRLHYAIKIFIEAFKSKRIRQLSLVLLIFIAGWSEYFSFVSQFLLRKFHYSTLQVSLFMSVMAIGFSIGFGFLVKPCSNKFDLKRCVLVSLLIGAIASLITAITDQVIVAWICSVFIGMSVSIAYSIIITMFSNQVNSEEQGWVMGITNSVGALSFGITALASGFAADFNPALPIYFTFMGLSLAAVVMWFSHPKKAQP